MRKPFRRIGLVTVLIALPLTFAPAGAAPFPHVIPIPNDFQPEGIAVGTGSTFYVGSLKDGDIYRGDLRTGQGALLVNTSGRVSVGMRVDDAHGYLVVAGGATGHAYVYDAATGADVADLPLGGSFVNDVAVTATAYYFTETFGPRIYKVPVHEDGTFGAPSAITLTGPAGTVVPGGFGLNGIDATPDGSTIIVNHTALGIVATVDPATGASEEIDVDGLIAGTPDGLQLEGHTLWVVENAANTLAKISLSPDFSSGTLVQEIHDPAFEVPTTTARFGSHMALINAKFDLGLPPPFGLGAPAGTPFEVVVVPAR
jgi:sugar lactone lactonase YvrE